MTETSGRRFSVIVTTHNRFEYMQEAVRSAVTQTVPPYEICIVDDGSTPPVRPLWEEAQPVPTDIPIVFVRIEDEGPAAARNAGAAATQGDFLAFLDDDDMMMPTYLERVRDHLNAESSEVTVAWLRCFDADREWSGKHFPTDHLQHDPYERNIGFVGSNIVVARSIYDKIGGFDASLLGSEDKDLYIRLKAADARIAVIEEELIRYRIHASEQASGSFGFHPFQVSGKRLFLQKHGAAMAPAVYKRLAADSGFFRLFGGKRVPDRIDGLLSVLRHEPTKLFSAVHVLLHKLRPR
ncbi:MAG: glycosyltransferase [Alphaproteobacteria bacterium]|nr:glycosyltransferase [Alphaproteobacteria bacterium]